MLVREADTALSKCLHLTVLAGHSICDRAHIVGLAGAAKCPRFAIRAAGNSTLDARATRNWGGNGGSHRGSGRSNRDV